MDNRNRRVLVLTPGKVMAVVSKIEPCVEPVGVFSSQFILNAVDDGEYAVVKVDGDTHHFMPLTDNQLEYLEESRTTEKRLHFSLWGKNNQTNVYRMLKSDLTYINHNPSLNHRCKRGLRDSLTNGYGKRVKFPRHRIRPQTCMSARKR